MKKLLKMRVALFTSNHLRHKHVAAQVNNVLDLQLIVSEEKNVAIKKVSENDELGLLEQHFKDRDHSEKEFFGEYIAFPKKPTVIKKEFGKINSQETLDLLKTYQIDYILLFGTSIIKPIILDAFPERVLNLHLGLSPYYKGSGTNFFPIANNEFECLGATIHVAIKKVDAGAILHQVRLKEFSEKDSVHSLGNRVIEKAGRIYPLVVKQYMEGKINGVAQNKIDDVKEYRIKDFTLSQLQKAKSVLENNGIPKFLVHKEEKWKAKPIVENYEEQ